MRTLVMNDKNCIHIFIKFSGQTRGATTMSKVVILFSHMPALGSHFLQQCLEPCIITTNNRA